MSISPIHGRVHAKRRRTPTRILLRDTSRAGGVRQKWTSRSAACSRHERSRLPCWQGLLRGELRSATGTGLHDLLDADGLAFDVLHVQTSSDDLTVTDLEQRHPAHLEGLAVATGYPTNAIRSKSCHHP